jgi:hypothetical protein
MSSIELNMANMTTHFTNWMQETRQLKDQPATDTKHSQNEYLKQFPYSPSKCADTHHTPDRSNLMQSQLTDDEHISQGF